MKMINAVLVTIVAQYYNTDEIGVDDIDSFISELKVLKKSIVKEKINDE